MIVVIDYKAGNLYNVGNALKHLQADFVFSGDPERVIQAEKVILPGVGSARSAMASLRQQGLDQVLPQLKVPFLGICLGLQLLFESSEEEGTGCLGIIPGSVRRFRPDHVKVPHIGWNEVNWQLGNGRQGEVLRGIPQREFYYFVHSYYAPESDGITLGTTDYDVCFASAVARDNFLGFQFHPERSGRAGLKLLENFINL